MGSAWRSLVAALTAQRGIDGAFLADISPLRDSGRYRPLVLAYEEFHPNLARRALGHRVSHDRMLDRIFEVDDVDLLQQLINSHRELQLEAELVTRAIGTRAMRCLQVLFEEAAPSSRQRVYIQFRRFHIPAKLPKCADFTELPQRFLWLAAVTQDARLCRVVQKGLLQLRPEKGEELKLWAACCGAACGVESLISDCGEDLTGPLARVSLRAWADGKEVTFDSVPLAVLAASRGHPKALERLAICGADMRLCSPRGLDAIEAARRYPAPDLRDRLLAALRNAGIPIPKPYLPGGLDDDPLTSAIKEGRLRVLQDMVKFGARLEARDVTTAVTAGDLEVLAYVQSQCAERKAACRLR